MPQAGQEPGVVAVLRRGGVGRRDRDVEGDRGHAGLVHQVVALRLERLVLTAALGDGVLEPEQLVDGRRVLLERVEVAQADPQGAEPLLDVDDLRGHVGAAAAGVHHRAEVLQGVHGAAEGGDRHPQHQLALLDPARRVVDGLLVVEGAVKPGEQLVDAVADLLRVGRMEGDVALLDHGLLLHDRALLGGAAGLVGLGSGGLGIGGRPVAEAAGGVVRGRRGTPAAAGAAAGENDETEDAGEGREARTCQVHAGRTGRRRGRFPTSAARSPPGRPPRPRPGP